MKNHLSSLLDIAVVLLILSCKKMDTHLPPTAKEDNQSSKNVIAASAWKMIDNWQPVAEGNSKTFQRVINDSVISASVATNGLVLMYAKNGITIDALPYQQKEGGNIYSWYYQVSEGTITILFNLSAAGKNINKQQDIRYFILSPDQLKDLKSRGFSNELLMQMSYEQAANLFEGQ